MSNNNANALLNPACDRCCVVFAEGGDVELLGRGLVIVFGYTLAMCIITAVVFWLRGRLRYV